MSIDEKQKEDNTIQFGENFYTLYNLHNNAIENDRLLAHSTIITDMFFEENSKENILNNCQIIRGNSLSEAYIFMLIHDSTSYVKLYSVDFMNQNYDNPIAIKCVKKVSVLNEVRDMFSFDLFELHQEYPKVLNVKKKMHKNLFEKSPCLKGLLRSVSTLKESILLSHSDGSFSLYYGAQCLFSYELSLPIQYRNLVDDSVSLPKIVDAKNFSSKFILLHLRF
jgi:hypothetical protein